MMLHFFTHPQATPLPLEPPAIGRLAEIGVPTLIYEQHISAGMQARPAHVSPTRRATWRVRAR
jgi:hypothetical protein